MSAHGVGQAPEGGAGEEEHREDAQEAPGGDQVIDLDAGAEGGAESVFADHPVGLNAVLAVEDGDEHQGERRDHLAEAERDHGEGGARPPRRDIADEDPEEQADETAEQRDEAHRHIRDLAVVNEVQVVDGEIAGEAEIDRMAEGQHPPLAEEHVVGEGEDDQQPHLAHHGEREARREKRRHRRERDGEGDPGPQAGEARGDARPGRIHTSRVPNSPRGLKTSMSTSSR